MAVPERETLLIVDDDELIQGVLTTFFEEHFNVVGATHLKEVKSALMQLPQPPHCALVDLGLPPAPHQPTEGFAVLSALQAQAPECAVVVVSGQDARRHGQRARALGAMDYAEKPCPPETLLDKLRQARQARRARQDGHGLIGESPPMAKLREQISMVAPLSFPVLIEGESGVGKELVARALHAHSRRGNAFLAINCAAIPEYLVEPTLFGSVKGAFTGAARDTIGYLGDCADGTLLFDEIADLPPSVQPKLLRVLETGEYQRVGETQTRQCTARIIASSNGSQQRVKGAPRRIRDDLYYRLSVFTIAVPPLRELGDDRFLLLKHFSAAIASDLSAPPFALSEAAAALWRGYRFPGNVRELKNIIARLQVGHSGSEVDEAQLREEFCLDELEDGKISDSAPPLVESEDDFGRITDRLAAAAARRALAACNGSAAQAALQLQVSEQALMRLVNSPH